MGENPLRGDGRHSFAKGKAIFTRNGATKFLSLDHLKQARFSVLLSNPLSNVDFYIIVDRTLAGLVVSLRDGVFEPARRPPANSTSFHSPDSVVQVVCCRYSRFPGLIFGPVCTFQNEKNTWSKSEKELTACHSFPQPQLY
jgi:hypothetical protein